MARLPLHSGTGFRPANNGFPNSFSFWLNDLVRGKCQSCPNHANPFLSKIPSRFCFSVKKNRFRAKKCLARSADKYIFPKIKLDFRITIFQIFAKSTEPPASRRLPGILRLLQLHRRRRRRRRRHLLHHLSLPIDGRRRLRIGRRPRVSGLRSGGDYLGVVAAAVVVQSTAGLVRGGRSIRYFFGGRGILPFLRENYLG